MPVLRFSRVDPKACEDHFRAARAIAGSDAGFSVKEFLERSHRVRTAFLLGSYLNQTHHKRSRLYDSGSLHPYLSEPWWSVARNRSVVPAGINNPRGSH